MIRKWGSVFVLALLTSCPNAFGQVAHGSTVVMFFSPNKVVLAADSRTVFDGPDGKESLGNSECKIFALNNHMIAGFAGAVGYDLAPGESGEGWSVRGVLSSVIAGRESKTPVEAIARAWGNKMKHILDSEMRRPDSRLPAQMSVPVAGVFAGLSRDNRLIVYWVELRRVSSPLPEVKVELGRYPYTHGRPEAVAGRVTGLKIVNELNDSITERAKKDHKAWLIESKKMRLTDRDARLTGRYVERIIDWGDDESIGGDVDILELTRKGSRWIRRKRDCPARLD